MYYVLSFSEALVYRLESKMNLYKTTNEEVYYLYNLLMEINYNLKNIKNSLHK